MFDIDDLNPDTTLPNTPNEFYLGNIALALSGGGYRASAFHLGMLDFLNQIELIDDVTMLSTVSGGSITGAKYIDELCKDPTKSNPDFFNNFYKSLYKFLETQALPDRWLEQIKPQKDNRSKVLKPTTPSLIRAAASIYSRPISIKNGGLVGDTRLGSIKALQSSFHVKEIIFNTTELHTGLGFRFRIGNLLGNKDKRFVGNKYFRLPAVVADKIQLADVVAASSCFPGGFEPMLFPQDFNWPEGSWKEIKNKIKSSLQTRDGILTTLPLTDGGIYDNLGVTALIEADKWLYEQSKNDKRSPIEKISINQRRIGTLILSDTDNIGIDEDPENKGYKKVFYNPPKAVNESKILQINLGQVSLLIPILFLLTLVSTIILWLGTLYLFSIQAWYLILLGFWIGFLLVIVTFILGILTDLISSLKSKSKKTLDYDLAFVQKKLLVPPKEVFGFQMVLEQLQTIIQDWNNFLYAFGGLSIADVINLSNSRLLSIEPLFLSFLKNQQRRSYDSIYESNVYRYESISCFIYDVKKAFLSCKKGSLAKRFSFVQDFDALEKMAKISDEATRTPTTLWFDKNNSEYQINTLIACGQFTMCFNLIEHLNRQKERGKTLSPQAQIVYKNALDFWRKFEKDPKFLTRN